MLHPKTEAELSEAIRSAKGPLRIVGGGTRPIGRVGPGDGVKVGLSGITLYDPGALTLVVQAGTPLAEITAALAAEGQQLPFEPMDHRGLLGTAGEPTIGAVAAMNNSGPRRIQAGAARDFMLGVRFVDGAGAVVKNGGRVMKNVTGYDLVKLMAGSFGTLGVLSEVAFKVLQMAETQATLAVPVTGPEAAFAAMSKAMGSPFEVTGAAYEPAPGAGLVYLRVEGFEQSVAYRAQALVGLVGGEVQTASPVWAGLRDVTRFAGHGFVARLSIKPSDMPGLCHHVAQAGVEVIADWAGGLVWVAAKVGDAGLLQALQGFCAAKGGHATLIKGAALRASVASFQPEAAALAALSAGLRAKFDPRGILNPGLMS